MRHLAIALLLTVGLCACAAPPLPEDHYYRLETGAPATEPGMLIDGTLAVQHVRMDGVYGERPLLYSDARAPTELRQYHYHYWADTPAQLVQEQLADYLRAARLARTVVLSRSGAVADYRIGAVVHRFEQRRDGAGAHVVVEIELAVFRSADTEPLFSGVYHVDNAVRDAAPLAMTQGLGQALTQCFARFVTDLRTVRLH